ncbi:MAG TPA: hypothetical protein PKM21_14385 [Anaerolineales bacterium]|nr:hypothetical protein [Anaerolineales bacterium]
MKSSLDLNLLPVARLGGQELTESPGLYTSTAPRKTARGRENDGLVLYLSMAGNAPLPGDQLSSLLQRLAQKYYKTSGSVTAAMRTLAEDLNLTLLDRNLQSSNSGKQGIGRLALIVLHGETVYLGHSGPLHTFLVTPQDTKEFHDPQGGRGLGLSRTATLRFYQAPLQGGDYLVCAPQMPPGWTANLLRHPQRLGLEGMRRQLFDFASGELEAVLIQALPGEGRLRTLRRKPGVSDMAHAAASQDQPVELPDAAAQPFRALEQPSPLPAAPAEAAVISAPVEPAEPSLPVPPVRSVDESPAAAPPPQPAPGTRPELISSSGLRRTGPGPDAARPAPEPAPSTPAPAAEPPPARPERKPRRERRDDLAPVLKVVGTLGSALGTTLAAFARGLGKLLRSILPDEGLLHLPPSVMIFVALAVPVVLSTIGGMVYAQRGRAAQYQLHYEQAVKAAETAAQQTEPAVLRQSWNDVLATLDKAEYYQSTEQSEALRLQAQQAIDRLDGIERLLFQPAVIGGLGDTIQVAGLVASETDLYILNGAQGNVLRAVFTSNGYKVDSNFQCGPTFGPTIVGPLVDIVALPKGSVENATLLGMDASGSIIYCIPGGEQPLTASLAPPNTGFGIPSAFDLDMGDLFVLDRDVNAVWVYRNMDTKTQPRLFFGDDIPPMQDVIDLAVNNDDLYLLHSDGHITQCIYSGMTAAPTRCEDPFIFSDTRPGRQGGRVIADALFNEVYFSSPPDPSIYMLDPENQAIYHFSVRLALQRQYRTFQPLPEGSATAFAISPNRLVFIAVGAEIFYAALP